MKTMKAFICNKDGCEVTSDTPPELQELMNDWDDKIKERIKERKISGCWNPETFKCDCPACGGFND